MMSAGLPEVVGLAASAFVSTNIDNAVVTVAMIANAPTARARRIASGQVMGFTLLVIAAAAMALLLYEIPTRVIGLFGLVPLALGIHGLLRLRRAEGRSRLTRRAFGRGRTAAIVVTVAAGGDNLAVYIPLFRVARFGGTAVALSVFAVLEVLLTFLILRAGRHERIRASMSTLGTYATPILYCAVGILVLVEAGTIPGL